MHTAPAVHSTLGHRQTSRGEGLVQPAKQPRVFVYFNLHLRCFSLRAVDGPARGRVVHHASLVELTDVQFRVSEAGRQRVLREKRKNVHAGATGLLQHFVPWQRGGPPPDTPDFVGLTAVTYCPYRFDSFVSQQGHQPVRAAARAVLHGKLVWVVAPRAD